MEPLTECLLLYDFPIFNIIYQLVYQVNDFNQQIYDFILKFEISNYNNSIPNSSMKLFVFLAITSLAAGREKASTKPVNTSPKIEYPSPFFQSSYFTDQLDKAQKKNENLSAYYNKVKGKDNNLRGANNVVDGTSNNLRGFTNLVRG
jgi:hypothetical protein